MSSSIIKARTLIFRSMPSLKLSRPLFGMKRQEFPMWTPEQCDPKNYKGFYRSLIDCVDRMPNLPEKSGSSQQIWGYFIDIMRDVIRAFISADLTSTTELVDIDTDMFGYAREIVTLKSPNKQWHFLLEFLTTISVESALGPIRRAIIDKLPRLWRSRLSNKFRARRNMIMRVWVDPDNYLDFYLYSENVPTADCGLGYLVENAKWAGIPSQMKQYGMNNYDLKQYEFRKRYFRTVRGVVRDDNERQFPRSVVERLRRTRKETPDGVDG